MNQPIQKMKISALYIFLSVVMVLKINAQNAWTNNTSNYVGGLYMSNGDLILATSEGYVRKSSDRTKSWSDLILLPSYNGFTRINNIYQYAKDTIYIFNDFRISKSVNAGATWTSLARPVVDYIYGMAFFDDTSGVVLGNKYSANPFIHRTSNGGSSWTKSIYTNLEYRGILKTDNKSAIAFGYTIQKTKDKGKTWFTATVSSPLINSVMTVAQASPTVLYAFQTGGTKFYVSTTSGDTWNSINTLPNEWVMASAFISTTTGWIGTANGNIYATTNSGQSWTKSLGICNQINTIRIKNNSILVTGRNGNIYLSENLGGIWQQLEGSQSCTNDNYVNAFSVTDSVGYCVGGNGATGFILKTTNGGKIFKKNTSYSGNYLTNVAFLNQKDGMIIGNGGSIYSTSDSAKTWTRITTASITSSLVFLAYPSKDSIFIGNATDVWYSYNAGATWEKSTTTLAGGTISSLQFINSKTGFMATGNGYLLGTTDGAKTWKALVNLGLWNYSFYSMALSQMSDEGILLGNGTAGRSSNKGISWACTYNNYQALQGLTNAQYITDKIIYAHNKSYSGISRSEDNGNTWKAETTRDWTSSPNIAFHFSNSGYGLLISKFQIQSKKDQGLSIVTAQEENLVKENQENKPQVFPNPASESITIVKFPMGEKYTIYDFTGREVMSSQANQVNIQSLAEGIYFIGNGSSPMIKFIKE